MENQNRRARKIKQKLFTVKNDLYDRKSFENMLVESNALYEVYKSDKSTLNDFPELLGDIFFSMFKYAPKLKEKSTNQLSKQIVENIMKSSDYEELRAFTKMDEIQSSLATAQTARTVIKENRDKIEQYNKIQAEMEKEAKDFKAIQKEMKKIQNTLKKPGLNNSQENSLKKQFNQLKKTLEESKNNYKNCQNKVKAVINGISSRHSLRKAVKKANDVCKLQDQFFSWSLQGGTNGTTGYKDRLYLSNKIMKNKQLLKIIKLAGKFKRLAMKKQKTKSKHAFDEIADIHQSDEISRLVSSEIMFLIDPSLEILFFSKFIEKKLLTYNISGEETKAKGPIIICIDVSGSMHGDKDIWCKAVALAMIQIAIKQKRSAMVIPFDSSVKRKFEFYKNKVQMTQMIEMASYFTGGGTNFTFPIQASMKYLSEDKELKKSDVIFITDGSGFLEDKTRVDYKNLKEELKTTMFTIVIGNEFNFINHELKKVSDKLVAVDELTDQLAEDLFESV